jgi:trigger factor
MQVSVENISTVETRLKIQVPAEEIKKKIDARLREIGKQVRLKGFRPGRIPFSVLNQRYGQQAKQEIIQQTAQTALQQALQQESLRIAANPRVENEPVYDESGLQFDAVIETYPELDTIDVSDLAIERPQVSVVDDDVTEMLETLQRQRTQWNDVERSPSDGDQALINYTAKIDGETLPKDGNFHLAIIIGESGFEGLEKVVRKMSPNDEKETKLQFPDDFRERALAGKKAEVTLTLAKVQESEVPEIDGEFAKSFGVESGDLDEFRTEVRKNLERELSQAVSTQLKSQLAERLLEKFPELEVPASIVTGEARNMLQQMLRGAKMEITKEMLDHFREPATKRVRSGLLLAELARQNKIKIDGSRVREAIEQIAQTYEEPAEVVQMYYSDQRLLQSVENSVLESQVVDWVVNNAKVTDKPMSFQEAINAATQAAGQ